MSTNKKTTIYLADDHGIFREGLKKILTTSAELEIIGESGDGKEALDEISSRKPDIVIQDLNMPGVGGLDIIGEIHKYYSNVKFIVLTRHDELGFMNRAFDAGASGYIVKSEAVDCLLQAITAVGVGNNYICPRMTKKIIEDGILTGNSAVEEPPAGAGPLDELTAKEKIVFKMTVEGDSIREIARKNWISAETVKVHRRNIRRKLGVSDLKELKELARRYGYLI